MIYFHIYDISRLSAHALSKKLDEKDLVYWRKRGEMDSIILMDEETSPQDQMDSMKPIWLLRDILMNVSIPFSFCE